MPDVNVTSLNVQKSSAFLGLIFDSLPHLSVIFNDNTLSHMYNRIYTHTLYA